MTELKHTFDSLGIAPKLLEILAKLQFTTPTPIQRQSIPIALEGKDIMGIAQTGTGKTLAFGIPMIQRLATHKGKGLIILPTRELAVQVDEALSKIGRPVGLKTAILIGGENLNKQVRQLKNNPHVIIATPGRLIDHLEQKTVTLSGVSILVLDEADRMLDMGFAPQIKRILQNVPGKRQTMLFSATMPQEIIQIANSYMQLPVRVEVAPPGQAAQTISQEVFFVHKQDKMSLLENILKQYQGSVLVFSRTKFGAKKIAHQLSQRGLGAAEIHSNRSLNQRLEALNGFKSGKYRVLVATDIAARGIDVTGIELVINFDLPEQAEDYVHRIGRTGRAQKLGHAISFATPEQKYDVKTIERLIKKQLPVSALPKLPQNQTLAVTGRPKFQPQSHAASRFSRQPKAPKPYYASPTKFGRQSRPHRGPAVPIPAGQRRDIFDPNLFPEATNSRQSMEHDRPRQPHGRRHGRHAQGSRRDRRHSRFAPNLRPARVPRGMPKDRAF
ncbi:MAG: DEAD/DEAH box helicase [Patescibacteria group bacterium]|nr:DEAD/DEAH box helicase [Patescibacteria group bacterium]